MTPEILLLIGGGVATLAMASFVGYLIVTARREHAEELRREAEARRQRAEDGPAPSTGDELSEEASEP